MVCELAAGRTATVYLAIDHRAEGVEKFVAVKRYLPEVTQRADFAELFIHEMRVARAVEHPYLCKVLDYGRAGASYYTAMEFLQGEPLSKVLTASGFLNLNQRSPRLIARLIANLAEGLHAAHSLRTEDGPADAVHQDITPSNLFALYDGNVRVTDFGTAWTRDVTGRKHNPGDMSYLAPEQLERGALDARVDIWALGVVLWELLAGQNLFRCSSEREAAVEITARRIPSPSEHHPQVPAELDRIVLKALARNRSKRYGSAHEFASELEQYLAHSGEPVTPSAVSEWLMQLFPTGVERGRGLIELANTLTRLPHFPDTDEPLPPNSGAFTPAAQDEGEHTTHIYTARLESTLRSAQGLSLEGPVETVSFKDIPTTIRRPARRPKRPLGTSFVPFAAAFGIVLLGFSLGHSFFSRPAGDSGAGSVPALATQHAHQSAAPAVQVSAAIAAPLPSAPRPPVVREPAPVANEPAATTAKPALTQDAPASAKKPGVASSKLASTEAATKATSTKPAAPVTTASTLATQPGAVFVTTPGGGDVYDRGRLLGRAPGEFELSPGWHTLIVKSGADNRTVTVQVPAGAAIMVSVPASKP